MSEIKPALLTRSEIDWLLGKSANLSKKTERDLRYRINKKLKVFMQTELLLLKDRGFAAAIGNDAAAISSGSSGRGEHSLVGRGIANPDGEVKELCESSKKQKRGEWDARAAFSSGGRRRQHFEPTCPFGHGISNPTPYQARRPPLGIRCIR